jgi:hypothetical protein
LYVYLFALIGAWCVLAIASGLLMVALAYLGSVVSESSGRETGLALGAGVAVGCLVGMADATVRSLLVYFDSRKRALDAHPGRLSYVARPRNWTLVVQLVIGVLVSLSLI